MYCPNCGKEVKEQDNFCRFCGFDLKDEDFIFEEKSELSEQNASEKEPEKEKFVYEGEELVLCEVERHPMILFWTIFLTPLFIIYFWTMFLNTHSIFSWFIMIGMLVLIVYPIICYKSEKFVITTKSAHIKMGVLKTIDIEIPLENFDVFDVTQSSFGRSFDYGTITFNYNSEKYDYPYVKSPEELLYIFQNPKEFIKEELKEEE